VTRDRVLIDTEELADVLSGDTPVVLADVRWSLAEPDGRPAYEAGHLPGAQFVDLEHELCGPRAPDGHGGRHPLPPPEAFTATMRRIGVSADTLVIGYDADTGLAASWLWWLLTDARHQRVRVLNGGYAAWVAGGGATESGPGRPTVLGTFVARPGLRAQADGDALAARVAAGESVLLVDVRAGERYRGEVEPMDPVAGHIPGALSYPSTENLAGDGRFLGPVELAERFAEIGDDPVLYCGSGITAAHSLLAMTVAGRTDASIYPGSWSDWVSYPDRPVATGPEPG
jgi:thiosulfate/3-mercaptopyruvate sulfurtransferase